MRKQFDIVIKGGAVVSFEEGRLMERHNVGIRGGVIKAVTAEEITGRNIINAAGKIVSPGFIDFHSHVDGKVYSAQRLALQGATMTIGGERNFDGNLIRKISEEGFLINHGFYISHSFTLRRAVGIKDPYRPATGKEIKDMIILAEQFFKNGSFGIHFGLEFVPGASEREMTELARLAKAYNRIVLIHLRKDGHETINSFREVINISQQTGASVHIQHLMYMAGFKGIMEKLLSMIREARSQGHDITADTGVYEAFPTCIGASILDRGWEKKYGEAVSAKNLVISSGIYAGQVCNEEYFQYLREEFPNTLVTVFVLDEPEIKRALKEPYVFVSTNAADGPHYEHIGHPETAGTFPRLIRRYVREEKTLSLLEAIGKITREPALRFNIRQRGEIKKENKADIVIFDYETIRDNARYVNRGDPNREPEGIEYVLVNGQIIVEKGKIYSEKKPGSVLNY